MSVPPSLERTLSILRSAFPGGVYDDDYLPVLRVLMEGLSFRTLRGVVSELTGYDEMSVYNDALGVAGALNLADPAVARVEALLVAQGWDPEDDE